LTQAWRYRKIILFFTIMNESWSSFSGISTENLGRIAFSAEGDSGQSGYGLFTSLA
jgi:hypothetical protein